MKQLRFFKKLNKKGFTFVECVCAIALFAIIGTMAFSMFTNSARYMSSAKDEDARQTAAMAAYKRDDFNGILLAEQNIVCNTVKDSADGTKEIFYAQLVYAIDGEDVTLMMPVTLVMQDGNEKTGIIGGHPYKCYKSNDGREIKVCTDESITENIYLDTDE